MEKDIPGVIAPPPLLYLGTLLIGLALDAWAPLPLQLPGSPWRTKIAIALGVAAVGLMAWQTAAFRRAGTPIPTSRPTRALALTGPYRYSRNPVYVSMALLYFALALAFGGLATLLLIVPLLVTIRYGVIAREEKYLERKFGDDYRDYRRRVRLWL